MARKILILGALVAASVVGPQARADSIAFEFSGAGYSGSGLLSYVPNVAPADPNPNCGTPGNDPCRTDPPGAYAITGISGIFSDSALGISNAAITGLVPINPADERDPSGFDPLVPSSLSFIDYTNEAAPSDALSYNNLFFPDGSPIDCAFPFSGTFLDVFGVAFTIDGGDSVVLWGDGDFLAPGTQTYGVGITDGVDELGYVFAGIDASVPEPSSMALLGAGLAGFGFARRRKSRSI